MPEDTVRGMVAGPTSLREFGKTGGASSDVESRPQLTTTAGSLFRTQAQLQRTLVQVPGAVGQVLGNSSRLLGVGSQPSQSPAGARDAIADTAVIDWWQMEEVNWCQYLSLQFLQDDCSLNVHKQRRHDCC